MIPRLIPQRDGACQVHLRNCFQASSSYCMVPADWAYESFFREIHTRYRDKMCYISGFIPELARKIYAGVDIYLKPSRTEPCGRADDFPATALCRLSARPAALKTA